ncbi:lysoplasmalogenase-like protein TMEM86A isoform X1 [Stegostoma tigrinum]|uniref:lysoplasmalogenase-like protein TMEM86A isoform X1 n=2 Tax=Stegostoma tigrinum TaxID=3053191 RepID=UPI00202B2D75|nr:lysoplasmalogenase-like protein TMEM86A isoform X1 [Stegostoma tigrinum]
MDIMGHDSRRQKKKFATMKSVGTKLIPFLKTFCIYFVLWLPTSNPSWFSALIKCLPVLCLGFFVLAHSISLGVHRPYAKKVLVALLFSALGDVFLTWGDQGFFIHGMLMFGISHLLYTWAFGLRPLRLWIALMLLLLGVIYYVAVYSYLRGPMIYAMAGYVVVLGLMSWRALARAACSSYDRTWGRSCTAVGAVIFIMSDLLLAIDRFCFTVPHARAIVMSTYYGAQMLISLSIVEQSEPEMFWKQN